MAKVDICSINSITHKSITMEAQIKIVNENKFIETVSVVGCQGVKVTNKSYSTPYWEGYGCIYIITLDGQTQHITGEFGQFDYVEDYGFEIVGAE
jgi:hypothetical protein